MKKSLFFLMLAIPAAGFAQNSKWSLGLNYSQGVSTVTNQPQAKMDLSSMAIAGQIFYRINQHVELSTGVQYSAEGFRSVYDNGQTPERLYFSITERSRFIRIPVQFRYTFMPEQQRVRPYVVTGVSAGFRCSGANDSRYFAYNDYSRDFLAKVDMVMTVSRKFDFGVYGGAGAKVRLGNRLSLTAEAGFYHGLIDAVQYDQEYNNPQKSYHQHLRGQVGLQFGL
ncbi:porin family protein [Edaphocola aurantiacus]|uniref:porin family protein n=1 Tax=Edaphocola aurantiacus TaxID=2601682 RepID=UPI001C93ED70|nr:porin family protein [Edaphocola aurantiacus]